MPAVTATAAHVVVRGRHLIGGHDKGDGRDAERPGRRERQQPSSGPVWEAAGGVGLAEATTEGGAIVQALAEELRHRAAAEDR